MSAVDEKRDASSVEVLEMFLDDARQRDDSAVVELRHGSALMNHRRLGLFFFASHTVFHLHAFVVSLVVDLSASYRHLNRHR